MISFHIRNLCGGLWNLWLLRNCGRGGKALGVRIDTGRGQRGTLPLRNNISPGRNVDAKPMRKRSRRGVL